MWQFNVIILLLILSVISSTTLSIYAWKRGTADWSKAYVVMMAIVAWWTFTYTCQLFTPDLKTQYLWNNLQQTVANNIGVSWLIFALLYTNRSQWVTRRHIFLLLLIPAVTYPFMWSSDPALQSLYRAQVTLRAEGPLWIIDIVNGPLFWYQLITAYAFVFIGIVLIALAFNRWSQPYKGQAAVLLVASFVPLAANIITNFKLLPLPNLDYTTLAFNITGLMMAWGLFRFRLFDLTPIARRTVVDNMADAVFVLDNQNQVVDINVAAQKMFDRTAAEVIGKSVLTLINRPDLLQQFQDVTDIHTEITVETSHQNTDASTWRSYDLHISPLYTRREDHLRGRLFILRDITSWKQAEQKLRAQKQALASLADEYRKAKEEAEEANKAKSAFLANMSHELRTPLNAIIGYSEMMQEDVQSHQYDSLSLDLQRVEQSGRRLLGLVNNILDLSEIEAGHKSLQLETADIAPLIDQVVQIITPLIQANQNELDISCSPDLGHILTDVVKFRQILYNILNNAAKFTENGRISLTITRGADSLCETAVRPPSTKTCPPEWLIMVITDTGIGITPEHMTQLFQPFTQADPSPTRKYEGTGLGLAISHHLCQMLGGTITASSQIDQGSTFTVHLPIYPSAQALEQERKQ